MVVKSKLGRKRYIIFKIDSETMISKRDLIFTLNKIVSIPNHQENYGILKNTKSTPSSETKKNIPESQSRGGVQQFPRMPWVISLKDNYGLIRCHHLDKEKTIQLLESIKYMGKIKNRVKIETLGTTGTIRTARKKYLDKLTLYPSNTLRTK